MNRHCKFKKNIKPLILNHVDPEHSEKKKAQTVRSCHKINWYFKDHIARKSERIQEKGKMKEEIDGQHHHSMDEIKPD